MRTYLKGCADIAIMLILIIATLLPTLALGFVLLGGPGVAVGVLVWMVVFIPAIVVIGVVLLEWLMD